MITKKKTPRNLVTNLPPNTVVLLDYAYELDIPEHIDFINSYIANTNIPEFMALKFRYVEKNMLNNYEISNCFYKNHFFFEDHTS